MPGKVQEFADDDLGSDDDIFVPKKPTKKKKKRKKVEVFAEDVIEGSKKFSKQDTRKLANITYEDGEAFFDTKTLRGIGNLVELFSLRDSSTMKETIKIVRKASEENWLLEESTPIYDFIQDEVSTLQKLEVKVNARKDVGVCRQCGCDEIIETVKQMCAGDEGSTVIRKCAKCFSRSIKQYKDKFVFSDGKGKKKSK